MFDEKILNFETVNMRFWGAGMLLEKRVPLLNGDSCRPDDGSDDSDGRLARPHTAV